MVTVEIMRNYLPKGMKWNFQSKKKKKKIIGDESFKKLFSNYFDEKNFFRKKPANELNKENAKRQTN